MQNNSNSPLVIMQPMNVLLLLVFYSPIILNAFILFASIITGSFKGLIYFAGFLLAAMAREVLYLMTTFDQPNKNGEAVGALCNMIRYSKYGNLTFSIFALSYSLIYICVPMFVNDDINWGIFGGLLVYLALDIGIRYAKGCYGTITEIFMNIVGGIFTGMIIPMIFYLSSLQKFLFINEVSMKNTTITTPKQTTFKCNVYKNGQLITPAENR